MTKEEVDGTDRNLPMKKVATFPLRRIIGMTASEGYLNEHEAPVVSDSFAEVNVSEPGTFLSCNFCRNVV